MVIPAGILITRKLEQQIKTRRSQKSYAFIIPLVLSALLSISITWADSILANNARSTATMICKKYSNKNQTIWFLGHWGYQYYMEQYGARPIDDRHRQFKRGDIITVPTRNTNVSRIPRKYVINEDSIQVPSSKYVATTDLDLGAGFYADVFGPLPFAFGFVKPDKFLIYDFKGNN